MAVLMFCHRAGIEMNPIRYRGTGPAQADLLAGTVMLGIDTASVYVPHIRNGALRAIGVSSARRMPQLPEVPTIAEQGINGYEAAVWYGAVGSTGIAPRISHRIASLIDAWLKSDAARRMLSDFGMTTLGGTPEDLAQAVKRELEVWRPVVQAARMEID